MNKRRARGGTKSFGRFWDKLRGNPPRTRGGNPLVVVGRREAKPNVAPSGRQTLEIRRASPIGAQGGSPPVAVRKHKGDEWGTTAAQALSGRKVEVRPPRRGGNAKVGQVGDERRVRPPRRNAPQKPKVSEGRLPKATAKPRTSARGETLNGARRSPDGNAAGSVRARLGEGEAQTRIETTQQTDKRQAAKGGGVGYPPSPKGELRSRRYAGCDSFTFNLQTMASYCGRPDPWWFRFPLGMR